MDDSLGTKKYRKEYKNYDRELRAYVGRQIDREQRIEKGLPVEDEFEAPLLRIHRVKQPSSLPARQLVGRRKLPLKKRPLPPPIQNLPPSLLVT